MVLFGREHKWGEKNWNMMQSPVRTRDRMWENARTWVSCANPSSSTTAHSPVSVPAHPWTVLRYAQSSFIFPFILPFFNSSSISSSAAPSRSSSGLIGELRTLGSKRYIFWTIFDNFCDDCVCAAIARRNREELELICWVARDPVRLLISFRSCRCCSDFLFWASTRVRRSSNPTARTGTWQVGSGFSRRAFSQSASFVALVGRP